MSNDNRREHKRIPFEQNGEAVITQQLEIEVVDISAGGMAFKTNLPLQPDSFCELVLFNGNVSVESTVRSCTRVNRKKSKYRVGASFTKVNSQLLEECLEMEKRFQRGAPRISSTVTNGTRPVVVFRFPEHLTEEDNTQMVKSVQDHLDDDIRHFVMDFAAVNEMDDPFFSQLVMIDEEVRYEEGIVIMANSSSQLLCTPQISQLATIIPIFESVQKALTSIDSDQLSAKEDE